MATCASAALLYSIFFKRRSGRSEVRNCAPRIPLSRSARIRRREKTATGALVYLNWAGGARSRPIAPYGFRKIRRPSPRGPISGRLGGSEFYAALVRRGVSP